MATIIILYSDISEENGCMIGTWDATVHSKSPRKYGEGVPATKKVVIPDRFTHIVNRAKAEHRSIRVEYKAILDGQMAHADMVYLI